MEETA